MLRNRSFDDFFSEGAIADFWATLAVEGDKTSNTGLLINLKKFKHDPASIVHAFESLIMDDENVSVGAVKHNKLSEGIRQRFLASKHQEIHQSLFDLATRHKHVWLNGKENYGLKVVHKRHKNGVSLVRSKGEQYLLVGQPR